MENVEPIISVRGLGIQFLRAVKHHFSIRELVFNRKSTAPTDHFWALKDVSFDVKPGEAVGLIGGNGSGKSTLLKLLAGVMLPDEGTVEVRGGVAPLIELTGGFLGQLSGRENIYLTGGIHGMTKEQVDAQFEEIVEFAGPQVRAGLEAPFRHFSSGMQVRLGFSLITTLDEPIVLVDEVLAVGDRKFQEKCYGRMEEMLADGRTLFLVSHSEDHLRRFCTRGLYLRNGELVHDGELGVAIDKYNRDLDAS